MYWLILVVSGLFEAAWATALDRSDGLTRPVPTVIFLVTCAISMFGLSYAMRGIPLGTAYAVWVGVGAATTVLVAIATGAESASIAKLLLLAGLVGCVVGLKFVSAPAES